jgi:Xaa-Pro aminopeptidase
MRSELPGISLLAAGGEVEALREIKSTGELAAIKKAAHLTDAAFYYLLGIIRPGMSELEIVALLYKFFLDNDSEGFSFDPIVASGENSSKPHAVAGRRKIRRGDLVTFDIGCKIDGYCSDFTRTVAIGAIDPELKKIYNIVLEANLRVLSKIADGISGFDADAAARDYINSEGFGGSFGHGTGHGVGLEIHEAPRLGASSKQILRAGMVVTDEPGIYLPGIGGVRIEDLVLVTNDGCEALSHAKKELIIL